MGGHSYGDATTYPIRCRSMQDARPPNRTRRRLILGLLLAGLMLLPTGISPAPAKVEGQTAITNDGISGGAANFTDITGSYADLAEVNLTTLRLLQTPFGDGARIMQKRGSAGPLDAPTAQFEVTTNWTVFRGSATADDGTVLAESPDPYLGPTSLLLQESGGLGETVIFHTPATPVNLSGLLPSIAVHVEGPSNAVFRLRLFDGANRILTAQDAFDMTKHPRAWTRLDLGYMTETAGTPDLTQVTKIELRVIDNNGTGTPVKVWVDDLRFTEAPPKGYVMITFDDIESEVYDYARPVLEKYGYVATNGVITDLVGAAGYMSRVQLDELRAKGWDAVSHHRTNTRLMDAGAGTIEDELKNSKRALLDFGWRESADQLFFRGGEVNTAVLNETRQWYTMAYRTTGINYTLTNPYMTNPLFIKRTFPYSDVTSIKAVIDMAAKYHQLVVIGWHTVGAGQEISAADLELVLKHISSKGRGIEVITATQLRDMMLSGPKSRGTNELTFENSGTATIPAASTSIVVTHGLNAVPSDKNVLVTPTNNLGSATKYWVSTVGATTFTINVDADPGATTATFSWRAKV